MTASGWLLLALGWCIASVAVCLLLCRLFAFGSRNDPPQHILDEITDGANVVQLRARASHNEGQI